MNDENRGSQENRARGGDEFASREHPSAARLEAFSDGVIAVIITIMVLELKVPLASGIAGFYNVLPALLVYLLSFAFTGIYWINHHELVRRIRQVDSFALYTNLLFLFFLSLLPFFTNYIVDKKIDAFSVVLYAAAMILSGTAFGFLRIAVNRILCFSGQLALEDIATQRKHLLSLAIYLIAIPLAYWRPRVALADISLVTLLWIVPSFGIHAGQALHQPLAQPPSKAR